MGDSAVSLGFVLAIVILRSLVDPHARRPSVIPDPDDLEHVASLQFELIASPWLISPQGGHFVVRMDLVFRVIILEGRKLL